MSNKTSSIYIRIPSSLKRKFIVACKKLQTTQQYVGINMVNETIKQAAGRTS